MEEEQEQEEELRFKQKKKKKCVQDYFMFLERHSNGVYVDFF